MSKTRKTLIGIASAVMAIALALSLGFSTVFAASSGDNGTKAGRYYSDYSSQAEAVAAAEDFNEELAGEGIVLLKNDGTLPVDTGAKVSVLGVAQDCLLETSGSITESLKGAGYTVNPTLEELYLSDGASASSFGSEPALNNSQRQSLRLYSDLAVVVIARGTTGESRDRSLNTGEVEDEEYLGTATGWEHEAHETDDSGEVSYRHELQLTASEEEMIALAEQSCDKVIVLYSAGYTFEMANLESDSNINAIAWIGRLGDGGIDAVGKIISGEITPSGKTVDEWTRDFTNDPTYANAFASSYTDEGASATGYSGIDYEEDIYLGYKYYETKWYELEKASVGSGDSWYGENVVYPFGYGLSYTSFSYDLQSVTTNTGDTISSGSTSISADSFSTSSKADLSTKITSITASVKVTNTGDVSGKETVEIYVQAPYESGKTEKPAWTLAGFGKTKTLKSGESQTLDITFNVQDFASFDYTDANEDSHYGYELDCGDYTIHVMDSSSNKSIVSSDNTKDNAYEACTFNIAAGTGNYTKAAHLDVDDFSGNKVEALFSTNPETEGNENDPQGDFYSMAVSADTGSMISPLDEGDSTMLSRTNIATATTSAPKDSELKLSSDALAALSKYEYLDADDGIDSEGDPWYKSDANIPESWTQGKGVKGTDGMYEITMDDMAGVALYDEKGDISGKWVEFINQLTWTEIGTLLNDGYHRTVALSTIGKMQTLDENGPNYTYGSTVWVGTPNVSASWNTELCERYGMMIGNIALWQGMTGWYGPGMNTHRSQFAGRTPEYYSQDALQGGYIASSVVAGATATGINVYIKHFAIYEVYQLMGGGCANISEQNMRENYLKVFQMAMQEGGSHAAMSSFNNIGTVYAGQNYALIQQLARDEWGWDGFIVTDINSSIDAMSIDGLIRAGAEIPDGSFDATDAKALSGTWDASYVNTDTEVEQGGVLLGDGEYSATQWYCARMAVTRLLYNMANSAGNFNGVTEESTSLSLTVSQGAELSESILPEKYTSADAGYDIGYEVVSGVMPEGVTITNGMLTGAALQDGSYEVSINLMIDGWIGVDFDLKLTVKPIITIEDDVTTFNVGDNVDTYILFDNSNIKYDSSYAVSISDGALPDGLELVSSFDWSSFSYVYDGHIKGTATTPGEYTFTVAIRAETNTEQVFDLDYAMDTLGWAFEMLGLDVSTEEARAETEAITRTLFGMFGANTDEEIYEFILSDTGQSIWDGALSLLISNASETYYKTFTITVLGDEAEAGSSTEAEEKTVANITVDSDGNLVIAYTDGTTSTIAVGGSSSDPTVSDGSTGGDESSSSGNGLATTGLVLAIVAIVLAAVVLVIVLLRRGGSNKSNDGESD